MTDFGTDLYCVDDIRPTFDLVSGRTGLAQALARRLSTPRGGLFYDTTYGLDLRAYLNADLDQGDAFRLEAAAASECERDERVARATAEVTFDQVAETLTIRIDIVPADGEAFRLVLDVTAVTVALLEVA